MELKKDKIIKGKIEKIEKDKYKVSTKFIVALSEYDIEVPSIMFYKIDENMELTVEFYLEKSAAIEGENE